MQKHDIIYLQQLVVPLVQQEQIHQNEIQQVAVQLVQHDIIVHEHRIKKYVLIDIQVMQVNHHNRIVIYNVVQEHI